jgi:hypothetical protein
VNPCGLSAALNVVALATLLAGLAAGLPGGLPLVAAGFVAWALARAQLKRC